MTTVLKKTESTGIDLEITREFNASPEDVFDAWTTTEALKLWMGPERATCPKVAANPVLDGEYSFPMEFENGDASTVVGHYTRIDRPNRLAFTWSWIQEDKSIGQPMHVSLEFERLDDNRTRMTMLHVNLIDDDARAAHDEGWAGCFKCLDKYLLK